MILGAGKNLAPKRHYGITSGIDRNRYRGRIIHVIDLAISHNISVVIIRVVGREPVHRLAQEQAEPMSDSHASAEYRSRMISVFVRRALRAAEERARL